MLDKPDEISDARLAKHLVSLFFRDLPEKMSGTYDVPTLTRYLTYARKHCHPKLTDDARGLLIRRYVEMRQQGIRNKTVTATPRQLESLIRLAEALARMRLSDSVEVDDVGEAVRLMTAATLQAATNPETGEIDMDLITTGRSAADRGRIEQMALELTGLLADRRKETFSVGEISSELRERMNMDVPIEDVRSAINQLVMEGTVGESGGGGYRKRRN
eukprot:SAG31_NODE_7844_length_1584_cov_1.072727_1_plen_217_part_00